MLRDIPLELRKLHQWVCHNDKIPIIAGDVRFKYTVYTKNLL